MKNSLAFMSAQWLYHIIIYQPLNRPSNCNSGRSTWCSIVFAWANLRATAKTDALHDARWCSHKQTTEQLQKRTHYMMHDRVCTSASVLVTSWRRWNGNLLELISCKWRETNFSFPSCHLCLLRPASNLTIHGALKERDLDRCLLGCLLGRLISCK